MLFVSELNGRSETRVNGMSLHEQWHGAVGR